MTIQSIEQRNWGPFLDTLSQTLIGKQAEIEVASLDLGDQMLAEWLPLLGISYDHKDNLVAVSLDGVDHLIPSPRELHADMDASGLAALIVIDDEGRRQIVRLKDPLALPSPAGGAG
jgi:hypothetical protein